MPISNVATIGSQPQTADTRQNDLGKKDIFLKLLVAQMKFQNPLKPQDPTKMSSQLAQFNMVEQQTNTNKLLQEMLDKGGTNNTAASSNTTATWLGHSVTVNQNKIHFNGTAQSFTAELPTAASTVSLSIVDANGTPVRTMSLGALPAGSNTLNWDGLMDNGTKAPVADYTLSINATDLQGQSVSAKILRNGIVDAVRFTSSGSQLMVGGIAASTADVTEIRP